MRSLLVPWNPAALAVGVVSAGYTEVTIPAHTWAIFPSELYTWEQFDQTIEALYHRFYSEWLPTAGYEQVDGLEFEIYGGRDGLHFVELWFAVRKI